MKKNISYEEALRRLETIVSELESGEINLESMAAQIKEAKSLVKLCQQKLHDVDAATEKLFTENDG